MQNSCVLFPVGPYGITEVLYRGKKTCVYRAIMMMRKDEQQQQQQQQQKTFLIKALENATLLDVARLSNEFSVLKELEQVEGVVRPVELISTPEKGLVLVLEDLHGQTLRRLMTLRKHQQQTGGGKMPLDLAQFFKVAIEVMRVVKRLHERGYVHKDIKPGNINLLFNNKEEEVRVELFGFGLCEKQRHHRGGQICAAASVTNQCQEITSARLDGALTEQEKEEREAKLKAGGTWPFMSPEQTGRTKSPVDYRTDFYSFGTIV